jgi:hypothetical protein
MQVNFEKKAAKAGHEAEAALSRTPQGIFEETQHPNFSRTRLIWGVLIATIYLVSVLIGMGDLGSGLSSDTVWYLQLSPYRQPMYGLWANAIYALSGSWHTVQVLQIAAFLSCSAWVIVELAVISGLGMLSAVLFAAMQFVLVRLGLLDIVASLLSEGLFYPMIMLMVAMLLTWLRTGRTGVLVGLALLLVAMSQLRTAALLVPAVPILAATCALALQPTRSASGRPAVFVVSTVFIGMVFMPPLFGKAILQVTTIKDATGFNLLPRVSLLPISRVLGERSPDWIAMSSSWRTAAEQLDAIGLTQFDAQLQEVIRYDLGPKVLLPAILNRSSEEIAEKWLKEGIYYDDAKRIAIEWILDEWPTYIRLSGMHLWGMLTMANFMDNADRERVWKALKAVSDLTWREAPFRTDYPLNRIYERLKWSTNTLYLLIRYVSIGILILGVISTVVVLRQILGNREVSRGSLVVVLAVGWSIAHSIPAALTVYPEFRYTYANMLVMFSSGAVWLAYLGARKSFQTLQESI